MKFRILSLILIVNLSSNAQNDTIFVNSKGLADSVFQGLSGKAPTGYLFNRLFDIDSNSITANLSNYQGNNASEKVSADVIYGLFNELNLMAFDSSLVNPVQEIYDEVYRFMALQEDSTNLYVYPISILDFKHNSFDLDEAINQGYILKQNNHLFDISPNNTSFVDEHQNAIIGPLFDFHGDEYMGVIFRKEDFISNYRSITEVQNIVLTYNGSDYPIEWDTKYGFVAQIDTIQSFTVQVNYNNGESVSNEVVINTPFIPTIIASPKDFSEDDFFEIDEDASCIGVFNYNQWSPGCAECGVIKENTNDVFENQLRWCFIPSCSREGLYNPKPVKPYILVAGWRPPLLGQNFKKTYRIYDNDHGALLSKLRKNDFDIILIKFNIHVKPYDMGLADCANLLEQFFIEFNDNIKSNDQHENVVQGSSMGEDIVRLALLKMEKKHFQDNSYPHHHCRLNIAHDANFYGANIPLGYQYQIYSSFWNGDYFTFQPLRLFLRIFLYSTLEQKSLKELLTYHGTGNFPETQYISNNFTQNIIPTQHWRKDGFDQELQSWSNSKHIFPMPQYVRNIGISLGRISGLNNDDAINGHRFNTAGQYWHNFDAGLYSIKIGAADYTSSGQYYNIFYRRKYHVNVFGLYSLGVRHIINVSKMQELDNCTGSYLAGAGNIIEVSDFAFFPISQLDFERHRFTHKSTLTALGINKNLWPTNGSASMDIQSLGLMLQTPSYQSDHFGYPHIGRPNDHFQITPFDAIYVDNRINAHIKLDDDNINDRDSLVGFMLNEVEPWYLSLQNQKVGSQARNNYPYYVTRIAKHVLKTGYNVTYTTSFGDYETESNSRVQLQAGDYVDLLPGTHFKAGSQVWVNLNYNNCETGELTKIQTGQNPDINLDVEENNNEDSVIVNSQKKSKIFPNPNDGREFQIKSVDEIKSVRIFDMKGSLIYHEEFNSDNRSVLIYPDINKGAYLLYVEYKKRSEIIKLLVY